MVRPWITPVIDRAPAVRSVAPPTAACSCRGSARRAIAPVPIIVPDLPEKLPWKLVNGVKEFHLHCMPVKREFLPGLFMDVWGFNGTMPGPTIEAVQGDRVRLVVHNELPESTAIHWHGLEMPVRFDGVPGLTQRSDPSRRNLRL